MATEVAGDTLPAAGDAEPRPAPGTDTACLSENSVLAFTLGQADRAQRDRIDAHVDECSMCARLVAGAARDGSLSASRSAPASAPGSFLPPLPTAFAKGSVLAGRFTISRFVARGGMGEVYEAFDQKIAARVALKTMLCTLGDSDAAMQRLCEEVKLARRIAHRNVCRIHDLHEHHDARNGAPLLFLAMEFVDGKTLKDCVRNNPLPPRTVGDLGLQLLRGLGAAHDAGVLHLDFKSQNVMLRDSGRAPEALIMDFSLSRAFDTEERMHASERQLVGTPGYISPEQVECRTALGPASDIYSFGVVFYEMLTGRIPFAGKSPSSLLLQQLTATVRKPSDVVPGLTPVFDRFVIKCLQRDTSLRFPDTASAIAALEACVAKLESVQTPALRARATRLLIVASVSASGAGLLAFSDRKPPRDPPRDIQSTATELLPEPQDDFLTRSPDVLGPALDGATALTAGSPLVGSLIPGSLTEAPATAALLADAPLAVASDPPRVRPAPAPAPAPKRKKPRASPRKAVTVEPARAEPARVEPARAEPVRAEATTTSTEVDGAAAPRPETPRWTPEKAPRRLY